MAHSLSAGRIAQRGARWLVAVGAACTALIATGDAVVPSTNAATLWVAPDGSDAATSAGTREQPFASPARALRHARELRRLKDPAVAEGVRIVLRAGDYALTAPLVVRWEDSGTATTPTRFEAAPGERPVVSGGVVLRGWRKLTSAQATAADSFNALPASARDQVWIADLPEWHGRPLEFRQLWVGKNKATRARTPNSAEMSRLRGWDRDAQTATVDSALIAALGSTSAAADLRGVELVVQQQWEIANLRVRAIARSTDGATATLRFHAPESALEFEHPWPQPILPPEGGGAFFLAGSAAWLDEPGEWAIDAAQGRVLYWPRAGEDLARDDDAAHRVVVPALETLVQVAGTLDRPVRHVEFHGIAFRHATWLRPSLAGHVPLQAGMFLTEAYKLRPKGTPEWRSLDNQAWIGRPPAAVVVSDAHGVRFSGCRFEQLAMNGLDFVRGAHGSTVEGCVFRDAGGNGLVLGGFQEGAIETHLPYDPADGREVCTGARIASNVFTDLANEDWGCVAVCVGYAREVAIEHNEIFNVSYTGISLGWGWTRTLNTARDHRVHANHIHHLATRMCDTAGVYTLSAQPGTVVSENVIHSVTMSPYVDRPDHWFYLYADEGTAHTTWRDNWCPEEKFLQNAVGAGNVWENNGPQVAEEIKARAGLQPEFQHLRTH